MTSLRQIESNRRNALKSTGPRTDSGKQRSSQNAVRHGLTAETVITLLEDPADYQAFELAVTADYDAETAVERELVLRLASLLWRLRRATSIETGLFQIEGETMRARRRSKQPRPGSQDRAVTAPFRRLEPAAGGLSDDAWSDGSDGRDAGQHEARAYADSPTDSRATDVRLNVARCFSHLADNAAFERLGRYEAAVWRQVRQTLFTLERLRWRSPSARALRTQNRWQRTTTLPLGPPELR